MDNSNLIESHEFVNTLDLFHNHLQSAQLQIEDSTYHVEFWTREQYARHINRTDQPAELPGFPMETLQGEDKVISATAPTSKPFKSGKNPDVFKTAEEFAAEVFPSGQKNIRLQEYLPREEQGETVDLSPWKVKPAAVAIETAPLKQEELLEMLHKVSLPGQLLTLRSEDSTYYISRSADTGHPSAYQVKTVHDNGQVSSHIEESAAQLAKILAQPDKPVQLLSFENTNDPILPVPDSDKANRVRRLLEELGPEEKLRVFYKNEKAMDIKRSGKAYVARQAAYPNTINLIGSGEQILATVLAVEGEAILAKDMTQWIHPLNEETLKTAIMRGEGIPGEDLTGKLEHAVEKYRFGKNGQFDYVSKGHQDIETLKFQETPCMSPKTKSLMLDVADGKVQPMPVIQQAQGMA